MQNLANRLTRIRLILLSALPAVLFFSYHPIISIASTETTNYELSLPLLWLALFSLLSFPVIFDKMRHHRFFRLAAILPIYCFTTILWSENRLRAFLTASIILGLEISIFSIPSLIKTDKLKKNLVRTLLISSAVVCVYCWIQCLLNILNINLGFCKGCSYINLGFPHPNGFAIEPQFMGGLLLAPILVGIYISEHNNDKKQGKDKNDKIVFASLILNLSTLFLTLSRGAIFALITALVILALKERRRILKPLALTAISFIIAISAHGIFATLAPNPDNFLSGTTKSLSQLTFGLIEPIKPEIPPAGEMAQPDSIFDGYIEESTNDRLDLAKKSIDLSNDTPQNIFLGIGLGDTGTELYRKFPELGSPKEIAQNEYIAILLELGLIGIFLIAATISVSIKFLKFKDQTKKHYLLALIAAYAVSLLFFSGLPNALYIYLLPVVLYSL